MNVRMHPMRVVIVHALFILSMGVPPLMVVSIPAMVWLYSRAIRRVNFVRHSRDHYLEERHILNTAKLFTAAGGRR